LVERTLQASLTLDAGPRADAEELEQLTRQLRAELLELDVESVNLLKAGKAPERTKVVEPISWGTILLTLAASGGVLTSLINLLQSWLNRHENSSLILEIQGDRLELKGISISSEDQQRLLEDWLSRRK
jgi:hypothetical protein